MEGELGDSYEDDEAFQNYNDQIFLSGRPNKGPFNLADLH